MVPLPTIPARDHRRARHPFIRALSAFFPSVPHPARGAVRVTASPYHIDDEPVHPRGPAAYRVGEHTRAVLAGLLGYDAGRIAELSSAGVIQAP